ncbi:MAG: glycosyltransferase family 4 protein [Candidatus Paceibacterota bacterium]
MSKTPTIRVLFNDAHVNMPGSKQIPQGGPARFAQNFSHYFAAHSKNISLISILFTHDELAKSVSFRKTTAASHDYYEVTYHSASLSNTFKNDYSKASYIDILSPWIKQIDAIFDIAQPTIVFLNGFSLTNWMIMEVAHRRGVTVCTQHAGIWKKELEVGKDRFSSSVRTIFVGFEKEIISKSNHLIFLNDHSRSTFFAVHTIKKTPLLFAKTSIIPLPLDTRGSREISLSKKPFYTIGMVARWDSIKNHAAIARVATYVHKKQLPYSFHIVTKWANGVVSNFKEKYQQLVTIVTPMQPDELKNFYISKDIFILPSKFETCGSVVMEAILYGKPVIISDQVGWVTEYRKFKLSKLIIPPSASGEKIANTISELIKNKELYISRLTQLQKHIAKEHSLPVVFKQYYQVFKKLS